MTARIKLFLLPLLALWLSGCTVAYANSGPSDRGFSRSIGVIIGVGATVIIMTLWHDDKLWSRKSNIPIALLGVAALFWLPGIAWLLLCIWGFCF